MLRIPLNRLRKNGLQRPHGAFHYLHVHPGCHAGKNSSGSVSKACASGLVNGVDRTGQLRSRVYSKLGSQPVVDPVALELVGPLAREEPPAAGWTGGTTGGVAGGTAAGGVPGTGSSALTTGSVFAGSITFESPLRRKHPPHRNHRSSLPN